MRIGHVHLKVRDLNRSEEFYRNLLGASQTERLNKQYSFLSLGQAHHDIALQEIGDTAKQPANDMIGLYHTAFEVGDTAELFRTIRKLEEIHAQYTIVDHGISWAIYTVDPDGNGVEVFLDRRNSSGGAARWSGNSRRLSKQEVEESVCR